MSKRVQRHPDSILLSAATFWGMGRTAGVIWFILVYLGLSMSSPVGTCRERDAASVLVKVSPHSIKSIRALEILEMKFTGMPSCLAVSAFLLSKFSYGSRPKQSSYVIQLQGYIQAYSTITEYSNLFKGTSD